MAPVNPNAIVGILRERGADYGDFVSQFDMAQEIKEAIGRGRMNAWQLEAVQMIATKLSRIGSGNPDKADNWRDIEGYAKLVADRLESEAKTSTPTEDELNDGQTGSRDRSEAPGRSPSFDHASGPGSPYQRA